MIKDVESGSKESEHRTTNNISVWHIFVSNLIFVQTETKSTEFGKRVGIRNSSF